MANSPESSPLVQAQSENVALRLAVLGLLLVVWANGFQLTVQKIDVAAMLANIGALLLIIGVLQWFFDRRVRDSFFRDIRSQIVEDTNVARSGISDFYADSKSVDFTEHFLSSSQVIIGVNYSAKLIDNSLELLRQRTKLGKPTKIVSVASGSEAAKYLAIEYHTQTVEAGLSKIKEIVKDLDPNGSHITISATPTILRYSFIKFDGRVWIVVGTNSSGRRAVPGFFVSMGGPWYDHYSSDVDAVGAKNP